MKIMKKSIFSFVSNIILGTSGDVLETFLLPKNDSIAPYDTSKYAQYIWRIVVHNGMSK